MSALVPKMGARSSAIAVSQFLPTPMLLRTERGIVELPLYTAGSAFVGADLCVRLNTWTSQRADTEVRPYRIPLTLPSPGRRGRRRFPFARGEREIGVP